MKKSLISLLVAAIIIVGCNKTEDDALSLEKIAVVASFLTPNQTPMVILSSAIAYSDDTTTVDDAISGQTLKISTEEMEYVMTESDTIPGTYLESSGNLEIEPGITYQLSFTYKDQDVSSSTIIPFKPENFEISDSTISVERITEDTGPGNPPSMEEVELTWDNDDANYYILNIKYLEEEYDTINTVFEIDDAEDRANFSTEPIQTDYFTIRSMQFSFFGKYQVVLSQITPEYAKLYESLSQSSLEGLTEPESNVTNGKGIFTSYNSDTLNIYVYESK